MEGKQNPPITILARVPTGQPWNVAHGPTDNPLVFSGLLILFRGHLKEARRMMLLELTM